MNEIHKVYELVYSSINEFIESTIFEGIFYQGLYYEFCGNHDEFRIITKDFKYKHAIDYSEICKKYNIEYRKTKPVNSGRRNARNTAIELLKLAKKRISEESRIDIISYLSENLGRSRPNVNASLNRSIGRSNVEYFLENDLKFSDIPNYSRDDLRIYFEYIRINNLTSLEEYRINLKLLINSNPAFTIKESVTSPSIEGWIYYFIIQKKSTNWLVKMGKSERRVSDRLREHSNSKLFLKHKWFISYNSGDIDFDEKVLLKLLDQNGEKKKGTKECFWINKDDFFNLWLLFVEKMNTISNTD